jgi:glycosyltransferase involved in cell wall biosynthesis
MKKQRIIFVCNALEDSTRFEREISSDSPAASKKIFLMAMALKRAGVKVVILSMGRGSQNNDGKYFKSKIVRHRGIPIVYAPFSQKPILSQLISFISLPYLLYRINNFKGTSTAIFYNRTTAYISALLMSSFIGYRRVLDLEDGEFFPNEKLSLHLFYNKCKSILYTRLCNGGTILACRALSSGHIKNELCYFGAIEQCVSEISWQSDSSIKFLLGGTVSFDTGAGNLIEAIKILRKKDEIWARKLEFIITGKGNCVEHFKKLAIDNTFPIVKVAGRLSDKEYSLMLDKCNVGMALKPNTGNLANTTFPSKVIELASSGLLVLTSDISDVRHVLKDGAIYLNDDSVNTLLKSLKYISQDTYSCIDIAKKGIFHVNESCSMEKAGSNLSEYLFR